MRPIPALARRIASSICLGLLLFCAACSPGKIELVSLQFKTIDPPRPQAIEVELHHAHWQLSDSGRLQVTATRESTIPFVNLRQRVLFSLELERLPNGKAKEYKLDKQTLRGYVEVGPQQGRFESLGGIAVVYRTEKEDTIRVLFRLIANRYTAQLLGGFGKPNRVLLQGEVLATRSDQVDAIIRETENGGFERKRPLVAD